MALAQRLLPFPREQHDAFTAECRRWIRELEEWRTRLVKRLPDDPEIAKAIHDAPVQVAECLADAAVTVEMALQWATGLVREIPNDAVAPSLLDREPDAYRAKLKLDE